MAEISYLEIWVQSILLSLAMLFLTGFSFCKILTIQVLHQNTFNVFKMLVAATQSWQ